MAGNTEYEDKSASDSDSEPLNPLPENIAFDVLTTRRELRVARFTVPRRSSNLVS